LRIGDPVLPPRFRATTAKRIDEKVSEGFRHRVEIPVTGTVRYVKVVVCDDASGLVGSKVVTVPG
jgi:hypothetical protein